MLLPYTHGDAKAGRVRLKVAKLTSPALGPFALPALWTSLRRTVRGDSSSRGLWTQTDTGLIDQAAPLRVGFLGAIVCRNPRLPPGCSRRK